jgi:hypothetical protein
MTQVLKHLKNSTIADGPDPTQVNPSDWNAAHVFSAGALGALLMRDTGDATYGASWLASVAAGSVLISNGVGAAPSWAASLTLSGTLVVNGFGNHQLVASGMGEEALYIQNTAAGATNVSTLCIGNDASARQFVMATQSSTYSPSPPFYANGTVFYQSGSGLTLVAAAVTGRIEFWTNGLKQWTIGSNGFLVQGVAATGNLYTTHQAGGATWGTTGTANTGVCFFVNANGIVGTISTSGSATAYNTSSDKRLKRDRGLARDTTVLEQTEIHDYDWIADVRPGRGVFSQDAYQIKPEANQPGTDERDAEGRLVRPWSTDYSKYVPDLIVGWQQHKARLDALEAAIARG